MVSGHLHQTPLQLVELNSAQRNNNVGRRGELGSLGKSNCQDQDSGLDERRARIATHKHSYALVWACALGGPEVRTTEPMVEGGCQRRVTILCFCLSARSSYLPLRIKRTEHAFSKHSKITAQR